MSWELLLPSLFWLTYQPISRNFYETLKKIKKIRVEIKWNTNVVVRKCLGPDPTQKLWDLLPQSFCIQFALWVQIYFLSHVILSLCLYLPLHHSVDDGDWNLGGCLAHPSVNPSNSRGDARLRNQVNLFVNGSHHCPNFLRFYGHLNYYQVYMLSSLMRQYFTKPRGWICATCWWNSLKSGACLLFRTFL